MKESSSQSRILAIDAARVLATLFMVQGHTLDVLLSSEYRQGTLFNTWMFLRGFTAPMFLVLAGFSFTIVTLRRWDSYSQVSGAFWKRTFRFSGFVLLGYILHMPVRSLRDLPRLNAAGWAGWGQVDVLQCIGMTMLCLQFLVVLAKTPKRFASFTSVLGLAVIILSPVLWGTQSAHHLPFGLAAYFDGNTGSLFPLFPWAAYVFAGATLAYGYSQRKSVSAFPLLWGGGLFLVAAAIILETLPVRVYSGLEFWNASPDLFLLRFGGICLMLAMVGVATEIAVVPKNLIHILAQNSLVVYSSHLVLVYGSAWNNGLRQRFGATLRPSETLAWAGLLLLAMILLAISWSWFKNRLREWTSPFRSSPKVNTAPDRPLAFVRLNQSLFD